MGVTRRYTVTLAETVRRYETIVTETDVDLEQMLNDTRESDPVPDVVLSELGNGDVVSADYGPADDSDYAVTIEDVEEVTEPDHVAFPVPYPPTTAEQAVAWVRWAETEIGVGWHPDTRGSDLVTFSPVGLEATCACGETFIPADTSDTIHIVNEKGDECGLYGVITNSWGSQAPLFPDPDVCARYDLGLEAAHELLDDIYRTSADLFREVNPDFPLPRKGE